MECKDYRGCHINDVYADFHKWTALEQRYQKRFNESPTTYVFEKLRECRLNKARCEDTINKYKRKAFKKNPWED